MYGGWGGGGASPRRALPLLGEVARSVEGVSGVGHGVGGKRQNAVRTILFPLGSPIAMAPPQSLRDSSPKRGAKGVDSTPRPSGRCRCHLVRSSPRRALPLLGEVPSAHTGERGLRGRLRCRREKTERSADRSFPYWQFLSHGDPSVSLALDSSPKRGAKGGDSTPRPAGRSP